MLKIVAASLLLGSFAFADEGYDTFTVGQVMVRSNGVIEVSKASGAFTAAPNLTDRAYIAAPVITDADTKKTMMATLLAAKATGAQVQCYVRNYDNSNFIRDVSILP